jgi:hypothetical protein
VGANEGGLRTATLTLLPDIKLLQVDKPKQVYGYNKTPSAYAVFAQLISDSASEINLQYTYHLFNNVALSLSHFHEFLFAVS